jgi:hypothetical protein
MTSQRTWCQFPNKQAAIRQMRRLKASGLSLRAIAARMAESGVRISHVGVQRALSQSKARERATIHMGHHRPTKLIRPSDSRQQWVAQQIRRLQANGLTTEAIAEELTALGVPISQATVRDVLQEAPR